MFHGVYYKVYALKSGFVTVVCLQDFDEPDYVASSFFKDDDGDDLVFFEESGAIDWVHEHIKYELIDEDIRRDEGIDLSQFYK